MSKTGVVIFVEGKSDKIFISQYLNYLTEKHSRIPDRKVIKVISLQGIGNYKSKAGRKIKNEIILKYPSYDIVTVCVYDTDVFEFSPKPPFDWNEIKRIFINSGVREVI